jgi:undecaprenyl diphosphate synthase
MLRTSGEQRLSGFMLWRMSYAELLFLDKTWPDMVEQDVSDMIDEFNRRNRRFGK